MAAILFDVHECARQLKEAGFTEQQAEAQARIMGQAFVHNIDQLVTRDYLDARLAKVEANLDHLEARVDGRITRLEANFRLVYWGQGLTIAAVVLPQLRQFLAG